MANLVQQHYLHSHKWTFFNYSNMIPMISPKPNTRLQVLISQLRAMLPNMLNKEQLFYADFGVSDRKQWENKYLIGGTENTDAQKILSIINSPQMIQILYSGVYASQEQLKQKLIKQVESLAKDNIPKAVIKDMQQVIASSAGETVGQIFNELGILGGGKGTGPTKNYNNTEIQKMLFSKVISKKKSANLGTIQKETSDTIKQYTRQLIKGSTSTKTRAQRSTEFLRTELQKKGFSEDKITTLVTAWKFILEQNLAKNEENRLVSNAITTITGEVDETGSVIAYIDFENPFEKNGNQITAIRSMVQQSGKQLVDRAGKRVKSKIDTIWTSPNGRRYNIQHKNSNAEIYRQFQLTNQLERLPNIPSYIALQGEISFTTLMDRFNMYNILSQEDEDILGYLLINQNVLNNVKELAKGNQHGNIAAEKTQAMIDQIISMGVQYFLSDLGTTENGIPSLAKDGNNDFVIFMGRFLIPLSMIIRNLIKFLEDYQNSIMRVYTTSYIKGFGQGQYNQMNIEKTEAKKDDPEPNNYDYHNENLVQVGSDYGKQALDKLKIRRISLKFKINNLINQSLI